MSSVFAATRDRTRRSALELASCHGTADEARVLFPSAPLLSTAWGPKPRGCASHARSNHIVYRVYRIGIYGIIHNIRNPPDPWCTIKAATGGKIHRTNATVSRPRQRELLSASWAIPRKRTSGKKGGTASSVRSQWGADCGASELLPFFLSLKERLQGFSLWAPVGGGVVG